MIPFLLICLISFVDAHSTLIRSLPNGYLITYEGEPWPASGHEARASGVGINKFGTDFKAANYTWTVAFCLLDSDGDGMSNGEELGDPGCNWKTGAQPGRTTGITHPGKPDHALIVEWTLLSSVPQNTVAYEAAQKLASRVSDLTNGRFKINVVVDGPLAGNAVRNGAYPACLTFPSYLNATDPTFSLITAMPFSMNPVATYAWLYQRQGLDRINQFLAKYNLIGFPAGNTGTQAGGWWLKRVYSLRDLKDIKVRMVGIGADVMRVLGAKPVAIPLAEAYACLKNKSAQMIEWIGPYEDSKYKFDEITKYYHFPGWWEGSALFYFFFNLDAWNALSPLYQTFLQVAAEEADLLAFAKYEAENPGALQTLIRQKRVQMIKFPFDVMSRAEAVANDVLEKYSKKNIDFRDILKSFKDFRTPSYKFNSVSSFPFNSYMIADLIKDL